MGAARSLRGSRDLARTHGLKPFRTSPDKEQGVGRRRNTLTLHDVLKDRRGDAGQGSAGDFLSLKVGQRFELGLADHLVRVAVIRAADDLQFAPACRRDQAEMSTRSCQVYGSGKKRLDREVGLHVGHFALDILSLQESLLPRHDLV